jgi:magnesium chelatase family protein
MRLSGPLADRIDMHVHVGAVSTRALGEDSGEERSSDVRSRVATARERQRARYRHRAGVRLNADVAGGWLFTHGGVTSAARALLETAAERLELSARGYHRALRVARTIADLDGADAVDDSVVAEALRYRPSTPQ